jgi:hypothetical protein
LFEFSFCSECRTLIYDNRRLYTRRIPNSLNSIEHLRLRLLWFRVAICRIGPQTVRRVLVPPVSSMFINLWRVSGLATKRNTRILGQYSINDRANGNNIRWGYLIIKLACRTMIVQPQSAADVAERSSELRMFNRDHEGIERTNVQTDSGFYCDSRPRVLSGRGLGLAENVQHNRGWLVA